MVSFHIRTFKIINKKLFILFGKISIFSEFSDVIFKWRNGLTTNVGTSKFVPMDSQIAMFLVTPYTIQMMTIGGILRSKE